jgi:hypothetical protein
MRVESFTSQAALEACSFCRLCASMQFVGRVLVRCRTSEFVSGPQRLARLTGWESGSQILRQSRRLLLAEQALSHGQK